MQVVYFVILVGLAILGAALFYSYQDKKGIRRNFARLLERVPGVLESSNPFVYPRATVEVEGRKITLSFMIVDVHRSSILNLVYRMPVEVPLTALFLKKAYYRGLDRVREELDAAAGVLVEDLVEGFVVRSPEPDRLRALWEDPEVQAHLKPLLKRFPNLFLDGRVLFASKPFEGSRDVQPEQMQQAVEEMARLGAVLERAVAREESPKPC